MELKGKWNYRAMPLGGSGTRTMSGYIVYLIVLTLIAEEWLTPPSASALSGAGKRVEMGNEKTRVSRSRAYCSAHRGTICGETA